MVLSAPPLVGVVVVPGFVQILRLLITPGVAESAHKIPVLVQISAMQISAN